MLEEKSVELEADKRGREDLSRGRAGGTLGNSTNFERMK